LIIGNMAALLKPPGSMIIKHEREGPRTRFTVGRVYTGKNLSTEIGAVQ
jgi:hypothetical protein